MYLLVIGLLLATLKYLELGPFSDLSWWWVLTPFGLAVVWWGWADWSGYTRAKAMERENARKKERIDKSREALGLATRQKRR